MLKLLGNWVIKKGRILKFEENQDLRERPSRSVKGDRKGGPFNPGEKRHQPAGRRNLKGVEREGGNQP